MSKQVSFYPAAWRDNRPENRWWDGSLFWEERFPFEDMNCDLCNRALSGYLDVDLETRKYIYAYQTIHILPDERSVCADCGVPQKIKIRKGEDK